MATRLPVGPFRDQTFTAGEDLTQYTIVKLTAVSSVSMADAGEQCIGIVQNAPSSGEQATVRTQGESFCSVDAGTAILITDFIIATTDGVGIKNVTDEAYVVGPTREAKASGTGNIVVDVQPQTVNVP